MTGYEFTEEISSCKLRHESIARSKLLTWHGQIKLANLVNNADHLRKFVDSKMRNITDRPEYREAYDAFIDFTMSCDKEEAKNWVGVIMTESIAYALVPRQGRETDWVYLFSASYDLYNHLNE